MPERPCLEAVVRRGLSGAGPCGWCFAARCGGRCSVGTVGPARLDGIYEVGSLTKVFTALVLARLVARQAVAIDAPAVRLLPGAPAPPGDPITLLDLATHTAGLPRLPPGLWTSAMLHPSDPYRGYSARRLERVGRRVLARPPRTRAYRYSNFGYGLLGHLLELAARRPYDELVHDLVCRPLGLGETFVDVPDAFSNRVVQGRRRGRTVPAWHLGALAGAGALKSTIRDLARLLAALVEPESTPLAQPIRATLGARRPIAPAAEVGLAWHHHRAGGRRTVWHDGATGGCAAFIGFCPERRCGVALIAAAHESHASLTTQGLRIVRELAAT